MSHVKQWLSLSPQETLIGIHARNGGLMPSEAILTRTLECNICCPQRTVSDFIGSRASRMGLVVSSESFLLLVRIICVSLDTCFACGWTQHVSRQRYSSLRTPVVLNGIDALSHRRNKHFARACVRKQIQF
jgi:hypothetical protein